MKTLKLVIDLEGLNLEEKKSPQETVVNVIKNIILNWAANEKKRGMNDEERRKYYKICDALEAAVKEGKEAVELEDDWMGMIREARKSGLMPNNLLRRVEALIDEVKDR